MARSRRILFVGNLASTHLNHWAKIYQSIYGRDVSIDIATIDDERNWEHGRIATVPNIFLHSPRPLRAAVLALIVHWISTRYDVVHSHSVGWYGVASLLSRRRPIATVYGSEVHRGGRWSFGKLTQAALFARAAVVHVTSQTTATHLRARHPSCNVVCLHTGVDPAEIGTGRRQADTREQVVIGHIRSVRPLYRTKEIIEALHDCLLNNNHYSMVVFTGHCDEAYLAECKALVRALGLETKVRFLGFLDRNALVEQLRDTTVALSLPVQDQIGASIMEALSVGVPVILTEGEIYEELRGKPGCYFLASMTDLPLLIEDIVSSGRPREGSLLPTEYAIDHVTREFSHLLNAHGLLRIR